MSASIATTTCTGWAPLIVAAVQGYSAWKPQELCETAEAAFVNAFLLLMGVILLFGPMGPMVISSKVYPPFF